MHQLKQNKPRIVFLYSDTGGGHRSAAEAIIEALEIEYPNQFQTKMIDLLREYTPPPFKYAPEFYPPLSKLPDVWKLGYRICDGRNRIRFIHDITYPTIRRYMYRALAENPCEMVVSVHPLFNYPVTRAIASRPIPFITVVTDMVSTHAFWYEKRADLVIVPTDEARRRGLLMGLRSEQLKVVGLPVADRFFQTMADKITLRRGFGWDEKLPLVLTVGGGDGMGPLERTAYAIDESGISLSQVIVCGRNQKLLAKMQEHPWTNPTHILGFTQEMPQLMRAADVLVTKAGPGTISEAFISGLPMILFSRMPGQEDGNVLYVTKEGAGVWAPRPDQVVAALRTWVEDPHAYQQAVAACRRLARPEAARQISRILSGFLQSKKKASSGMP